MVKSVIEQDIKEIIQQLKPELKKLSNKTLLISGGAGFIGRYIVDTILEINKILSDKPCKIVSIDNFLTGYEKGTRNKNFLQINQNISKPLFINGSINYIIHAAGVASPVYYKKYPLQTIEAAVWGAKNLLELAKVKKVSSFLFFSSSEIYGDPDPSFIPTSEEYNGNVSCIGPRSCYDESKRMGETLCMSYFDVYQMPVKIVRPFNIFGPGMRPNDYRVIPTFVYNGLQKKHLPVHDKGNQTRTFCYITDAVVAIFKVLLHGKGGEVYNIGNDANEINMMSLAQTINSVLPNLVEIKMVNYPKTYPKAEPQRRCPDLTKIKTKLNFQPQVDLKTGLVRTIKWYRQTYNL